MTQEQKHLLLKDLCARLPYGVKLNFYASATRENYTCMLLGIEPNDNESIIAKVDTGAFKFPAEHIKPYLRPMSSMTEEEKEGYINTFTNMWDAVDWLNAHHFDYRIDPSTGKTLIESNLAIEAPEGMYKIEEL